MSRSLPREVRARVVALAADLLTTLPEEQVPAAVRPFRRFAPRRRAQAAAVPLAAALEQDNAFRQLVSESLPQDLAAAVRGGTPPPAAPPEEVACAAYLLRPDGWEAVVEAVATELAERDRLAAGAATVDEVRRLTEQLEALRSSGREEAERLTAERDAARAEAAAAVRRAREAGSRAAAAERRLAAATPAPNAELSGAEVSRAEVSRAEVSRAEVSRAEVSRAAVSRAAVSRAAVPEAAVPEAVDEAGAPVDGAAEVRRLRTRLRAAEDALSAARSAARGERREAQVRLRVLLDAVVGAASGLQRELALAPLDERPADALAATLTGPAGTPAASPQGRSDDDPALLDALLTVPAVHLLVDGYNVTKSGYGEQVLEVQRGRLLAGAGALAARTGVELTVVFDGAGLDGARAPVTVAPRGVRLLFSGPGQTADDVLRALVRAEPPGRPLVVVSSDREVADDVRRDGARAVPSRALLALLERGSR